MNYTRIATLKTAGEFSACLQAAGAALEFDPELLSGPESPLARPFRLPDFTIGNRFCVQPMEGWDADANGNPTDLTLRRWRRFGESGAKLVWGGEAAAVLPEARGNPNQLLAMESTLAGLAKLRKTLVEAHARRWRRDDLYIGLQLTHAGRFCRPAPKILYRHPILDRKFGIPDDYPLIGDAEISAIVEAYGKAAAVAQRAGFHFIDIKHCHGYLGHEFLSAVDRPGRYGGCFENRTRFLKEVIETVRASAPGLAIGVRLSAFDFIPFKRGVDGIGAPEDWSGGGRYPYAFGGDGTGMGFDLTEPLRLLGLLDALGVRLVNVSAGSPYYVPHVTRPAMYPPSDGYASPEDPLAGVARLINMTAQLKARCQGPPIVGSGYTYLQEWLPNVAQNVVRTGKADFVGLGRMILAYPELCADVLEGRPLQRKRLCRTFSDCTSAPRNGLVSGCYPLDGFYRNRPESAALKALKKSLQDRQAESLREL